MLRKIFFNKQFEIRVTLLVMFVFVGCGTMFDGKEKSPNNISIPKEVSMEIPKILKENKVSQKSHFFKIEDENISKGYKQLKENTQEIEGNQKFMKINLLLAEQIIDEVVKQCQGTELATICKIEENLISFVFNDKFIEDVREILGSDSDDNIDEERGRVYSLGEVEFTQYDENESYQYNLKINTNSLTQTPEDNATTTQSIKWSKDENRVFTYSTREDKKESSNMGIHYTRKENGEKEMSIRDNYRTKGILDEGTFYLNILDKNDSDETFEINSTLETNGEFEGEVYIDKSISSGKISNQGGFLSISSRADIQLLKEKYLFDGDGNIIASKYCANGLTCNLNDPATWLDMNSIAIGAEPVYLTGTGGKLQKNVRYLLFKPNANIEQHMSITQENELLLFSWVLGELYLYENNIYATLYSDTYLNQVDELIMASIDIEDVTNIVIKLVAQEDKPTLYIY